MTPFFRNVTTNFAIDISFNMRMIKDVKGIIFMMQSWIRAQFDKKKCAKREQISVFSLVFLKNKDQISLFLLKNVNIHFVTTLC